MQIYEESLIGDKEVYDALLANYRQEYENYHINEIQTITGEQNRRMQVSNSCVFVITIISFIAIFAFVIVSSAYWFFGKINSSLQSTSLSNNVISAVKIAFLFAYPAFFSWIVFNPFCSKFHRWKINSDA